MMEYTLSCCFLFSSSAHAGSSWTVSLDPGSWDPLGILVQSPDGLGNLQDTLIIAISQHHEKEAQNFIITSALEKVLWYTGFCPAAPKKQSYLSYKHKCHFVELLINHLYLPPRMRGRDPRWRRCSRTSGRTRTPSSPPHGSLFGTPHPEEIFFSQCNRKSG